MQTTPKQENSNELQIPKHRLITRSNFDGIVNTALFLKLGIVDEILFVHPKDVQEGKVEVTTDDIVSNLPYVQNAHMAFDHLIDTPDVMKINKNHALFTDARSVSEIIYEYSVVKRSSVKSCWRLLKRRIAPKRRILRKKRCSHPKGGTG